jgi:phage gpG-like protein
VIKAYVVGDKETIARLKGAPPKVLDRLRKAVTILTIKLQRKVKQDKLSGQVLHVRTGTLRRSINQKVESKNSKIIGTVGTNVHYAAIHEFGFKGTETVKAHVRRVKSRDYFRGKRKVAVGIALVSAHTRKMDMPQRSFLRSSLQDMKDDIRSTLQDAVNKAMKTVTKS